jgi:hypothetical protein
VLPHRDGPDKPNVGGDVYLRNPDCGGVCDDADAASGRMLRMALVLRDDIRGLMVKVPGSASADPKTGRLTATFDDNPQLPFTKLRVSLKGGSQGVLAMPETCGDRSTTTTLTPWSASKGGTGPGPFDDKFTVGGDCSHRFAPGFSAGMSSSHAGGSGTFAFDFSRRDGQQRFAGLTATLPTGLLAKVRDVPLCPEDLAASGHCPAASQVGTVTAGAGSGDPYYLPGTASLAGAYKGAPYSLVVSVPAKAGPIDLGNVVVRQALNVDIKDAHVTAVSDPIPTILAGVPLRIRQIRVDINRAGFMVNPTNCSAKAIGTSITSTLGTAANLSSHFQATGCETLGFSPTLKMQLINSRETRDGGHPGLEAVLTQDPGEANMNRAEVTLPLSMALDPENAQALCEFADGLRGVCPESSVVGTATAVSPLLKGPLKGKVYFVKNVRFNAKGQPIRTLPTLLVQLRGEIALDLRATSDVDENGALVNTFSEIPDAALSSFHLTLNGGKHGILVVTHDQDVCDGPQRAFIVAQAQNSKRSDNPVSIAAPCPKSAKVASASVRGHTVRVSVKVPSAGTLRVRGSNGHLASVTRKVKKAGKVTITLKPTKAGAKSLARHGRLKVKIGVRWLPKGGKKPRLASTTVTLKK